MEDIVSEITAQALNQLSDNRTEQARQEFERAMEEVANALPANDFGGMLSPEEEAMLAAAMENEHQEIPVNSQTITVDETTSRFSGAIWYEEIQKQVVTLAGIGGIGRFGNLINF